MLVVLVLIQLQGTLSLDALQHDRQSLFEETCDKGGYVYGADLGARHLVLFPVRRGDVLYYLSTNDEKCVATCWERVAGKPVLRWQILLREGSKQALAKGSLARLIYGNGYGLTTESPTIWDRGLLPDRGSRAWRKAKPHFERTGSFVSYDVRIHGDVGASSSAYLIRADGTDVERFDGVWGPKSILLGPSKTEFKDLSKFKRRSPCDGAAVEETSGSSSDQDPCSS